MDITGWLLQGEPWVAYNTCLHLLGHAADSPVLIALRQAMVSHPLVAAILDELPAWETQQVNSHKNAGLLMHKLSFLADIGLGMNIPQIRNVVDLISRHRANEGVTQVLANIPVHFGGSGQPLWTWSLCDAPVVMQALLRLGFRDAAMDSGIVHLRSHARENGWPCAVAENMKFRGPGRKDDPCPYASLSMMKLLAAAGQGLSREASLGVECLLGLWERSREEHPYIFYMGTDFRKLKAPLLWHDILHVADTLSLFPQVRADARFTDMIETIKAKEDGQGRYTPESIWTAWKDWEFGQKKEPSRWLTFLILRMFKRLED